MRSPAQHIRTGAALIAGVLLQGCVIPIPVPERYHYTSRQNLGHCVPDFIVPGKTTREDVLLALGQADGAALDESWLSYGCAYGKGGVFVFVYPSPAMPAFEAVEYRRLVVYFDEAGVVDRAQWDQRTCQEVEVVTQGSDVKPRPCIDLAGKDLPLVRERQEAKD